MSWRVARSLDVLLGQLNRAYPGRSIASDGSIGDAAHATRDSDHNPHYILDGWGIVTARDYTNDPAHGFDAHALAERLRLSRDRRIKYVISNGRIFSSTTSPWTWRTYTGTNPHSKHIHLSVVASRLCDDTSPWSAVNATLGSRIPDLTPMEDDLANVTDAEKARLLEAADRVLGMMVQRFGPSGPHRVLDTADGDTLRQDIAASASRAVAETSSAFHQLVALLQGQDGGDVDPVKLAAALADALPADIAGRVADELAARLTNGA